MNAIETINKLKTILGIETPKVELALSFGKLEDGSIISYDKFEVGSIVNLVAEDGTSTPLTEGDYTLEDGSKFSVDASGAITAITPIEMATEDTTSTDTTSTNAPSTEDQTPDMESRITAIEDSLSSLVDAITSLIEKNNLQLSEMQAKVDEAEAKVIELSKAPSTESITKQPSVEIHELSKLEQRIAAINLATKK